MYMTLRMSVNLSLISLLVRTTVVAKLVLAVQMFKIRLKILHGTSLTNDVVAL